MGDGATEGRGGEAIDWLWDLSMTSLVVISVTQQSYSIIVEEDEDEDEEEEEEEGC